MLDTWTRYSLLATRDSGTLMQTDPIRDLLSQVKTIAVVGLSDSPMRPSHGVSAYMQTHGYRIIPVNPQIPEALGEKSYPSLLDVPGEAAVSQRLARRLNDVAHAREHACRDAEERHDDRPGAVGDVVEGPPALQRDRCLSCRRR